MAWWSSSHIFAIQAEQVVGYDRVERSVSSSPALYKNAALTAELIPHRQFTPEDAN